MDPVPSIYNNKPLKGYVVYFSQIVICYIIILSCIGCIVCGVALGKEENNLFIVLCSSAIGYILPNPSIKDNKRESPSNHNTGLSDSETASNTQSHSSRKWWFFGKQIPRSEIVFFSQVIICYIIILISVGCLAIGEPSPNDYMFTILTSSSLGYLLPSPRIKIKSKTVVYNNTP